MVIAPHSHFPGHTSPLDASLPTYMTATSSYTSTKRCKRRRTTSQTTVKRRVVESDKHEPSTKRARAPDRNKLPADLRQLQPTLNLFDIFSEPHRMFLPVITDTA